MSVSVGNVVFCHRCTLIVCVVMSISIYAMHILYILLYLFMCFYASISYYCGVWIVYNSIKYKHTLYCLFTNICVCWSSIVYTNCISYWESICLLFLLNFIIILYVIHWIAKNQCNIVSMHLLHIYLIANSHHNAIILFLAIW